MTMRSKKSLASGKNIRTLERSLELRDVIRPVLLKLAEAPGMKCGAITILNKDHGEVTISEAVALPAGREEEYLRACRELVRQVTDTGQAIVVKDVRGQFVRFASTLNSQPSTDIESLSEKWVARATRPLRSATRRRERRWATLQQSRAYCMAITGFKLSRHRSPHRWRDFWRAFAA
jgi:hypothetical protein